jgi:hypothetical protein
MSFRPTPTQKRLRELFSYDPDTGFFTRKQKSPRRAAGETLRPKRDDCYLSIAVDGTTFPAHRLVWKYITGEEPNVIDHINGVKGDNRLSNLRSVDNTQNTWNRSRRTSIESPFVGVFRAAGGLKWKARVLTPEGLVWVGPFTTPDAASEARDQLLLLYRGSHHRL